MFSYFNLRRPSEFSNKVTSDGSGSSGQVTPNYGPVPSQSPLTVQQAGIQQPGSNSRPTSFSESQLSSRPPSVQFDPLPPNFGLQQNFQVGQKPGFSSIGENTGENGNSNGGGIAGGLVGIRSVLFQNTNNNNTGRDF